MKFVIPPSSIIANRKYLGLRGKKPKQNRPHLFSQLWKWARYIRGAYGAFLHTYCLGHESI